MGSVKRGWDLGSFHAVTRQPLRTPISRPSMWRRARCAVMGHGPFHGGWLEITCLRCKHTWRAK